MKVVSSDDDDVRHSNKVASHVKQLPFRPLLFSAIINVLVVNLQAPYFRGKCIDECATVSYFRNYQNRIL